MFSRKKTVYDHDLPGVRTTAGDTSADAVRVHNIFLRACTASPELAPIEVYFRDAYTKTIADKGAYIAPSRILPYFHSVFTQEYADKAYPVFYSYLCAKHIHACISDLSHGMTLTAVQRGILESILRNAGDDTYVPYLVNGLLDEETRYARAFAETHYDEMTSNLKNIIQLGSIDALEDQAGGKKSYAYTWIALTAVTIGCLIF